MTRYRLDLMAEPCDVPEAVRLRRMLKLCLRAFRLRCVSVEQVDRPAIPPAVADAGGSQPRPARAIRRGTKGSAPFLSIDRKHDKTSVGNHE